MGVYTMVHPLQIHLCPKKLTVIILAAYLWNAHIGQLSQFLFERLVAFPRGARVVLRPKACSLSEQLPIGKALPRHLRKKRESYFKKKIEIIAAKSLLAIGEIIYNIPIRRHY